MVKKSSKIKSVYKRVSADEAKVPNVKYSFYTCETCGYLHSDGKLVHVKVEGVVVNLKDQSVVSRLTDAYGKDYVIQEDYNLYLTISDFENNLQMHKNNYSTLDMLKLADRKRLCGCNCHVCDPDEEKGTSNVYLEAWIFENGQAISIPLQIVAILNKDYSWSLDEGSLPDEFWSSRKIAYDNNEYEVIDEDGEVLLERGTELRLRPTKEQSYLLLALKNAFDKAKESGLSFIWDRSNGGNVYALNNADVAYMGYDICPSQGGSCPSINDLLLTDTGISFYDYCGNESNECIALKPSPRELKKFKKENPDA